MVFLVFLFLCFIVLSEAVNSAEAAVALIFLVTFSFILNIVDETLKSSVNEEVESLKNGYISFLSLEKIFISSLLNLNNLLIHKFTALSTELFSTYLNVIGLIYDKSFCSFDKSFFNLYKQSFIFSLVFKINNFFYFYNLSKKSSRLKANVLQVLSS